MQSYTQKLLRLLRPPQKNGLHVKMFKKKMLDKIYLLWRWCLVSSFLRLVFEEFFLSLLVGGCMIHPESVALQTAAVLQAEARGRYPAAALCAASIIQRMTNSIKSRREGRNYVSVVSAGVH